MNHAHAGVAPIAGMIRQISQPVCDEPRSATLVDGALPVCALDRLIAEAHSPDARASTMAVVRTRSPQPQRQARGLRGLTGK